MNGPKNSIRLKERTKISGLSRSRNSSKLTNIAKSSSVMEKSDISFVLEVARKFIVSMFTVKGQLKGPDLDPRTSDLHRKFFQKAMRIPSPRVK